MKKESWLVIVLAVLFLFGCKQAKEDNPQPREDENKGTELLNSPSQFSGTIDGQPLFYSEGSSITNLNGSSGSISGGTSSYIYQSSLFHNTLKNIIEINKGSLNFTGDKPGEEPFKGFFNAGAVSFSKGALNGVEIIWYDNIYGYTWSTSDGTGDQTGSSFTIEEVQGVSVQSKYYVKIKAKFNCKLYNGTRQIQLTDGVFVGTFGIN